MMKFERQRWKKKKKVNRAPMASAQALAVLQDWWCFQVGGRPGGQVAAPRRPLDGNMRGFSTPLSHFPPYLSLSSFSLILLLPTWDPSTFHQSFYSIHHQILLFIIIIIIILVECLIWSSLSLLLVRENEGRGRPMTLLAFHRLPPLSKVIFELNPPYYTMD